MNNCTCKLSLRLCWDFSKISTDDVSLALNLTPRFCWNKDAPRITPKGNALSGTREESYWTTQLADCDICDIHTAMNRCLRDLRGHTEFVGKFLEKGGRAVLFIGFIGEGTFGQRVEAKMLKEISDLGLDLEFEVYGSPVEEDEGDQTNTPSAKSQSELQIHEDTFQ